MAEAHQDEIAKLEALYASNPEGRVFTHLAEAYRKAGDRDRAQQILSEGLRRHPNSASAYVVLGRVLADGGDSEASITAFRQALDLDAGNLVALRWLGDLTVRVGRVDEAIGFYHELISRDPSDVNLLDRVAVLEADRAAGMSAPPATDHPGEPVELPPEIESPAGVREAAADLTDIEALAVADEGAGDIASDDVLSALAAAERRADPLESLAYAPEEPAFGDVVSEAPPVDAPIIGTPVDEPVFETQVDELVFEPMVEAAAVPELEEIGTAESEPPLFELSTDDIADLAPDPGMDLPADEVMELSVEDMVAQPADQAADDFIADEGLGLSAVDVGGFTDAVGGEAPGIGSPYEQAAQPPRAPVTETMAELYRNQGFPERAAEVYRQLLRERGSDARLERLLAEIDLEQGGIGDSSPDAAVFKQDASGELWLQEVESPWVDGSAGHASHDTPYAWPDDAEDAGSTAPAIGTYFSSLLGWRPRSADDATLLLDDEASTYAETGAAHRFMDAPTETADAEEADRDYIGAATYDDHTGTPATEADAAAAAAAASGPDPWDMADLDTIEGAGSAPAVSDAAVYGGDSFDAAEFETGTFEAAALESGPVETDTSEMGTSEAGAFETGAFAAEPAGTDSGFDAGAGTADDEAGVGYGFGGDEGTSELMPWETAPSSFGPPAPPATPAEAMPWETPAHESTAEPATPAEDLMPWETSPAAAQTPPEASRPEEPAPPWSVADETLAGPSGAVVSDWSMGHTGGSHPAGTEEAAEEVEDDEDLEMFRSWLQSLKK